MHSIRLRGPWQIEPLERFVRRGDGRYERSTETLPPAASAKMPSDWSEALGRDFLGRVRYLRTFHEPTGLDIGGERVWLVVEPPRSVARVSVNGIALGQVAAGGPPARFDITARLQYANRLEIVVDHPVLDDAGAPNDDSSTTSPGGLVGEVRLEIEE
jgi:hypothetical protein